MSRKPKVEVRITISPKAGHENAIQAVAKAVAELRAASEEEAPGVWPGNSRFDLTVEWHTTGGPTMAELKEAIEYVKPRLESGLLP